MLAIYDYSLLINDKDISNAIKEIDNLLDNGKWFKDRPSYQTEGNLFELKEFEKFQYSFEQSCLMIINRDINKYKSTAFCYMDYFDNWKLKQQECCWHDHSDTNLTGVMYLKNDERLMHQFSGTEFRDQEPRWTQPEPYHWYIFLGTAMHRPGIITTNNKRYVLTGLFNIYE